MKRRRLFFLLMFFIQPFITDSLFSQNNGTARNWDNQSYMGNKVAWGKNSWRYSGEWQVRLENNMQQLDNWFLEVAATYLWTYKIELVPDFRISVKPDELEYRPGLGVLYKIFRKNLQIVNQFKWQLDIDTRGNFDNGVRYAIFLNYKTDNDLIATFAAGAFYRWQKNFIGFQYIRFGPGVTYVFDKRHTLNFSYLLSDTNNGRFWEKAGIIVVQLIININTHFKFAPAKYFSF